MPNSLSVPRLHRTISGSSISSVNSASPLTNTYSITPESLSELHDPKSLRKLREIGGLKSLVGALNSDVRNGVNDENVEDIESRKEHYGTNVLPVKTSKSFLELCWLAMHDKVLIVLIIAAVVSLALGLYETFGVGTEYDDEHVPLPKVDYVEGVAIIVAVVIVVLVGAANDYQKERQFAKLNAKKEDREVIVIRNGSQKMISIHDVLVGDLINLQTGDVVPCDCILVTGEIECDESALTGESDTIEKLPADDCLSIYESQLPTEEDIGSSVIKLRDPFLISGSKVLSGLGDALVTAVGPHSIHGRTMMSLNHEAETTPLQERLDNLAEGISKYGMLAALVLFIVLFIRFCINIAPGGNLHNVVGAVKGKHFLDILITAITIVVVAVPEGLPLAVTLALAFATTRMAQNGNLVRVLKSCETMGGATAICSDKTGTLTMNKMRIVKGFFSSDHEFDISAGGHGPNLEELSIEDDLKESLIQNITLNSTAFANGQYDKFKEEEEGKKTIQKPHAHQSGFLSRMFHNNNKERINQAIKEMEKGEPFLGNKTESALLILARDKFNIFQDQSLDTIRENAKSSIVQVIPFESSRKWSGVVVNKPDGKGYRLYIKGAAEILFKKCGFSYDGTVLDRAGRDIVLNKIDEYANDALRAIALCHLDYNIPSWPSAELVSDSNHDNADPDKIWESTESKPFVLDALVGLQDPLKPGVPEAVLKCKHAGVTVRMITGDNLITAKAISTQCHILTSEDLSNEYAYMEGPAFRKLSAQQKCEIVPQLRVLARSSPEDKRVLVDILRKQREVVAVTGDGTNDAPALKLADVGFSMGIAGTEVAREASDIILMTDDFNDIVQAIKWGRTVSTSIKKFIQFQLTVNITACVLTFVSAVASKEGKSVLTAVQLLWVNLIMDTLAALALATDKPDEAFLNRRPAGRTAPLISTSMWKMIIGQSITQLIVTFVLHFRGDILFFGTHHINNHQEKQLDAMTFNAFVWLQVWKLVVTRKLDEADDVKQVRKRLTRENLDFFQHLFRNWYFIIITLIIIGFQILIMFVGGAAFSTSRQTGGMWATALLCGFISIPAGLIIRIIPNHWVERVFPTKAFNKFLYACSFKWMFKRKMNKDLEKADEEEHVH